LSSPLIIGGALANCGRDVSTDDFLQFLLQETHELAIFKLQPRPGHIVAAAFDWQGVLGTAADILAFASVLWTAYEKFVKPNSENNTISTKPFLFINLRRTDGSFVQFSIGKAENEKQAFIEHFSKQVSELRATPSANDDSEVISTITQQDDWVRIRIDT
jgi:hypothetical protein